MATPQEREQQRKQKRQDDFDRQVDSGSLVVRQMTPEERLKYAESPEAAAERAAQQAAEFLTFTALGMPSPNHPHTELFWVYIANEPSRLSRLPEPSETNPLPCAPIGRKSLYSLA